MSRFRLRGRLLFDPVTIHHSGERIWLAPGAARLPGGRRLSTFFLSNGASKVAAKQKTLIFIPTYEERENVGPMCEGIIELGLDADVLFVDDNSPDGTGEALEDIAAKHARVTVLHRPGKLGIGSAHLDGIAYAYEHGYARLVTMDSDFTHAPSDIPRLLAAMDTQRAALVTGSRFQNAESLPGWSPIRKALTHLGHLMTRRMLGVTSDATGAFRVYDLTAIPRQLFELVTERGYAFFFQSMFIMEQNGFRIVEVPIILPARTYGHSKMNSAEVARSVEQLSRLYVERRVNPAKFRLSQIDIDVNLQLRDSQGWDSYWEDKTGPGALTYDVVANIYRNLFIKSNLNRVIRREFAQGACLLHAGCGSGGVDVDLHDHFDITAVDISLQALRRYSRENPHVHGLRHADVRDLPFAEASFDGAYNLGVVEHFAGDELHRLFVELARVTKPGGKVVVFWPHKHATSAMVLDSVHYMLNDVMRKNVRLHPPEPTRIASKKQADEAFQAAGLELIRYDFGVRDLFIQAVAVGRRPLAA